MALIACHECSKQISDKAPACPHCGAPAIPPSKVSERDQYAAVFPDMQTKPTSPWPAIISLGVLAVIAVSCVSMSGGSKSSDAPAAATFDSTDALWLCVSALKRVSRDPEKAEVPYVANQGSGGEFRFIWGANTKMARMRNGFGLEVATTASCTVNAAQKKITSLTLDGKQIL